MNLSLDIQDYPDEIITPAILQIKCQQLGYKISLPRFRVYVQAKAIQPPKLSSNKGQQHGGRSANYHYGSPIEAVTAHLLLNGILPAAEPTTEHDQKILRKLMLADIARARNKFIDNDVTNLPANLKPYAAEMAKQIVDSSDFSLIKESGNVYVAKLTDAFKDILTSTTNQLVDEMTTRRNQDEQNRILYAAVFIRLACRDILING